MAANAIITAIIAMTVMGLGIGATTLDLEDSDLSSEGLVELEEDNKPDQKNLEDMRKAFLNRDLDSDGVANCEDPDDDADGINDTQDEYPHDHDNDGIPDCKDDDDDDDGISDEEDDEYVGNCSRPERKFGHGFRKFHLRHQNRPQNRTLLKDRGYRF